jgi:surface polysaccharide O-acyltransferase-like enzyme
MKNAGRYAYIDLMRVLAMLCVVLLHSSFYCLNGDTTTQLWHNVNIITSLATASVPVFFMISGALILSSKNTSSPRYTVIHRLPHLIMPLIFWSVVSIAKDFRYTALYSSTGFVWDDFIAAVYKIPSEPVSVHFWFMYALIPLYILSPIIKQIADNADRRIMRYMLCVWVLAAIVYEIRFFLPPETAELLNISFIDKINIVDGYLGYFILGYYLCNKKINIRASVLIVVFVLMIGVIAYGTAYYTILNGSYNEHFKSYCDIAVMILSADIFLLCKKIKKMPRILRIVLRYLSNVSFGVYLVHNIFISIFSHEGMVLDTGEGCFNCFWLTTVLSILLTTLLMSLPVVCKITTGNKYSGMITTFLKRSKN